MFDWRHLTCDKPERHSPGVSEMNARVVGLIVAVVSLSACRPRQVDVRTAPPQQQQAQVSVQVNNNLTQAVNVYVSLNGTDTFLRQVAGGSSSTIPVQGFATGSSVTLKAVTVDGVRTYQRQNVVLTGTVTFPLP
jgi:hypothetical protein